MNKFFKYNGFMSILMILSIGLLESDYGKNYLISQNRGIRSIVYCEKDRLFPIFQGTKIDPDGKLLVKCEKDSKCVIEKNYDNHLESVCEVVLYQEEPINPVITFFDQNLSSYSIKTILETKTYNHNELSVYFWTNDYDQPCFNKLNDNPREKTLEPQDIPKFGEPLGYCIQIPPEESNFNDSIPALLTVSFYKSR